MTTTTAPKRSRRGLAGYSELLVPGLLLALTAFLAHGTITMEIAGNSVPGPEFFPIILCVVLFVVAVVLIVQILWRPSPPQDVDDTRTADFSSDMLSDFGDLDTKAQRVVEGHRPWYRGGRWNTYTDWRTVAMVVGGVAVSILVLPLAGWILTATFLFWIVSWALGSTRRLFDASIALLFASVIQLAFGAGLGLALPVGFLEGLLTWNS